MPGQRTNELSDPVTKEQAAKLLGISASSVYESMRRFDAARILGDVEATRRHIPCIHRGGVEQPNGTFRGGRYIIPRDAFIRWYKTAGMSGSIESGLGGGPDVPTADAEARIGLADTRELVITIRLIMDNGALRALAELSPEDSSRP